MGKQRITVDGFEMRLDPGVFDDFELLDMMAQVQNEDALKLPGVMRKIYGDQYHAVMEHLRDEDTGRVPTERVGEFMTKTMEALAPKSGS